MAKIGSGTLAGRVLNRIHPYVWYTYSELMYILNAKREAMASAMLMLLELGFAESRNGPPRGRGGPAKEWCIVKRPPAEPLYETPGWDARPLAACYNGYTFTTGDTHGN